LKAKLVKAEQILEWHPALPGQSGGNPGSEAPKLPGVVLDDAQAEKTGEWASGTLDARVGGGYIHDSNANKGAATVRWTIVSPEDGKYDLNLFFAPSPNRATNVPVTVTIGNDVVETKVNQQDASGVAKLGNFNLAKGSKAVITLSNQGTTGHVIADGVQALKAGVGNTRPSGAN
jgi:hypothetical protein